MKNPFGARGQGFDAAAINDTIQRALASAGLDTQSGPMRNVTDTIRRALSSAGNGEVRSATVDDDSIIDVDATLVDSVDSPHRQPTPEPKTADASPRGRFETHSFSNSAGTRPYKVYVPATTGDTASRPMVVMLHGCTQSADDFAAGTRMNKLADTHGFVVVYPEQTVSANASKCWNWFSTQDQLRDSGEPSLIAGIVRKVAAEHSIDPRRIFVAGLSAGAAMAVILGETYPELFAGVGAHSGLPYSSAHDLPSAMAAMKGGRSGIKSLKGLPGARAADRLQVAHAVPLIVFHGDRDHTVQQSNAAEIVRQAASAHGAEDAAGGATMQKSTQRGTSPNGRSYSRTVFADASGQPQIESWTVHGAGHAWSGGAAQGSYTDGAGPDASAEMLRFFQSLPRAGTS